MSYNPVVPTCGGCGETTSDGARYCGSCGRPLGDGARAPARRTVTVLFTDISGFTGLAEKLDEEPLRALTATFYDEMAAVVRRYGGTPARFMGDAVMAVFGIPELHEDDAIRAVYAALEMQERVEVLNEELEKQLGVRIPVRTGINTGEVATSEANLRDALVVGDAVNVAARLQQMALPGQILLGAGTSRLVRDSVRMDALPPLAVKGRGATVNAWRVVGLDEGGGRRAGRAGRSLVGRDAELEALGGVFNEVVERRSCRLALILGEAGIGKSQLVAEFMRRVDDDSAGAAVYGSCQPYGERPPLAPIAEIVRQGAGLPPSADVDAARSRLLELLNGAEDGAAVVAHLLSVLGLAGGPGSGPDEMAWGTRKLFERLAAERPLVVVLDDLHWAPPTLLSVVQHVRDWSRDVPILLVCLARPELLERDPSLEAGTTRIRLNPLTAEDSGRLVETLLGGDPVASTSLLRITAAARGNPLYLEEIVSTLREEGVLRPTNGRWVLTRETPSITAPLPIRAMLAARLDRLPWERRAVLETASVVGTAFSVKALRALLPHKLHDGLAESLAWLTSHLFLAHVAVDGEELQFHHELLREAAYAGLAKERRAQLHELFAEWLIDIQAAGGGEDDAVIGYHLEQASLYAAELRPGGDYSARLARRAGERLGSAGCRSFDSGDMPGAAATLSRAAALLPADDPLRLCLLPSLAEAVMGTGELGRAVEVAEEAVVRAGAVGLPNVEARGMLLRSIIRVFTDREGGAEALRDVRSILPALEELGDDAGLAKAWHLLSMAEVAQSHFAAAEDAMERAAAHAQRSGDRQQELEILSWLPLPIWIGPTPADTGIRRYDEILARAGGDPKVGAMVSVMRGALEAMFGEFEEAHRSVANARSVLEDLGLRLLIAGTAQVAGWIDLLSGDLSSAECELAAGHAALEEMGETGLLSTLAGWWAQALYRLDRHDDAERTAKLAESMAGPTDSFSLAIARAVQAKVLATRGRFEAADSTGREALLVARRTDSPQLIGDVLMDLGHVRRMAGDRAEAEKLVLAAMKQYQEKGNLVSLRDAQVAHDAA